jgi:ADP-heptose:LPS heptosyltransferase
VHTCAFPGFERGAPPAGWRAYLRLVREARRLREGRFDIAVNLRPDFWWGAALLALAGVPIRIGFDVPPGSRGLTHRLPPPDRAEHTVRRALRAVRGAAQVAGAQLLPDARWQPGELPLAFQPAAADWRWADAWYSQHELSSTNRPILLHPGSGAAIKLWEPELWARSLADLSAGLGAPVVVAGAPAEAGLVDTVLAAMPRSVRAIRFAEHVSLGRYAALIGRARLTLGVDSGPLHLATAVGCPTVRLHGPTDPALFGPWGPAELHAVVASHLPCAFCGRLDYSPGELSAHPCVRLLTPEAVVAAARRVLAEVARQAPTGPIASGPWQSESKVS